MNRRPLRLLPTLLLLPGLLAPACSREEAPDPVSALPAQRQLDLDGAPGPARIITDELGVRHIYGQGLEATLFAQGYVSAYDRFWQMDVFRRVATGRLTEYLPDLALAMDVEMRTIMMTRDGRFLEEALVEHLREVDPGMMRLLDAYVDGVNAWLADVRAGRNDAALPPEYAFFLIRRSADEIADWRPEDSLAIGRLQAWSLSADVETKIGRWERRLALPDDVFADIWRLQPPSPAVTLGPGGATGNLIPQAERTPALLQPPPEPGAATRRALPAIVRQLGENARRIPWGSRHDDGFGSNNWMVSGRLTDSGHPMLANDPHLALFNPPVWHTVHLDPSWRGGSGLPTSGVIFPGLPGVILGFNSHIAWGSTVIGYDVTDVYLETVRETGDVPEVWHEGAWKPVIRREVEFVQADGSVRVVPIDIVPHHGPQVADPDPDDDLVGIAGGGFMSFAWTGHELSNDIRFLHNLNQARNVEEARNALRYFTTGAQNWIVIDRKGDMLYFPHAWVPVRPEGFEYWFPVTGDGSADWATEADGVTRRWIAEQDLPQAFNPPEGLLVTANQDTRGELQDGDPTNDGPYLYAFRAPGYRQERILELLDDTDGNRNGRPISIEDMGRYQMDIQVLEARYVLDAALPDLKAADLSPAAAAALARLDTWRHQATHPLRAASGVDPASARKDWPFITSIDEAERRDAVATSIFYAWLSRVVEQTFGDELEAAGLSLPSGADASTALLHLLRHADSDDPSRQIHTADVPGGESRLWNDIRTTETETRQEILARSLELAVDDLADLFGTTNADEWLWGRIHVLVLQHFFQTGGITGEWSVGNAPRIPLHGARYTVSPANFGIGGPLTEKPVSSGASKRFVVEMRPDGPRGWNAIPGGQFGHALDARDRPEMDQIRPDLHYSDLLPDWLRGERFAYRFIVPEVVAGAEDVWEIRR